MVSSTSIVGFTTYHPWFCFSPAKNNLTDGAALRKKGLPSGTPIESEWDFYNWH